MAGFTVRRAGAADLTSVLDLLGDGAARARSAGFDQWPARFDADLVAGDIDRSQVLVVRVGASLVATCTLHLSDLRTWGPDDGTAGYVHRLAVAASHRGQGLGLRLLDRAQGELVSGGRRLLRVDCLAVNASLRRWYEGAGFVHQGDRYARAGAYRRVWMSLYQRAHPNGG